MYSNRLHEIVKEKVITLIDPENQELTREVAEQIMDDYRDMLDEYIEVDLNSILTNIDKSVKEHFSSSRLKA